jgi:putative DNA primase/helicase
LEAADADLTRCYIVDAVQDIGQDGQLQQRGFSLATDLDRLATELDRIGDVAIVIIDPITAYLGSDLDSHRTADVRALLEPVRRLAERYLVAIVAVSHLRKAADGDAILRVTGSLAFVAAARATYIVTRDSHDSDRRLFLPAKNNLGTDIAGYAYRIEPVTLAGEVIETCRIVWDEELVTVSADEALSARSGEDARVTRRDMAADWLRLVLIDGPLAVAEIQTGAKDAGLSWATVRRAANDLGVVTGKDGYTEGWSWRLPDDAQPGTEIEL